MILCCQQAFIVVSMSVDGISAQADSCELTVWGLTPLSGICPRRLVFLLQHPFVCTTNGASQELLCCGLVPAYGCIGFVTTGRVSPIGQGRLLLLIAQEYQVGATK